MVSVPDAASSVPQINVAKPSSVVLSIIEESWPRIVAGSEPPNAYARIE
jgi:hypothetical protein